MPVIHIPADGSLEGAQIEIGTGSKVDIVPIGVDFSATQDQIDVLVSAGIPISRVTLPAGQAVIPKSYGRTPKIGINGKIVQLPLAKAFTPTAEQIRVLRRSAVPYVGINLDVSLPEPVPSDPSFIAAPSILTDGTPAVGETLVGVDGVVINGSVSKRQWFKMGATTPITEGNLFVPTEVGKYVFRNIATGGGDTTPALAISAAVDVANVGVTPPPVGSSVFGAGNWNDTAAWSDNDTWKDAS